MKHIAFLIVALLSFNHSFGSEKYISTKDAKEILNKGNSFFVFFETRENPITKFDSIPESKLKETASCKLTACPEEFYIFQLGVWAIQSDMNVKIEFSDLKGSNNSIVSKDKMTCFNQEGIDIHGNKMKRDVNIPESRVRAMLIGLDLAGVSKGNYSGVVTVVGNGEKQTIPVNLKVDGEAVANHGYDKGSGLSRLNWLNSTVGLNEDITKGYTPVEINKNTVQILGRTLQIDASGLPASINSFFGPSNQMLVSKGEALINSSFRFIVEKEDGEAIRLSPGKLTVTEQTPSKVVWNVVNTSAECDLVCTGQMEFDGFVDYKLELTSKVPLKVKDIRLEIPVAQEKAEYMMGLNHEGGLRTPDWKWKWDAAKNQDMLWVGAVNGGFRIKLKAENYVRPLVNIYYAFGPLMMPPSWFNDGEGGVNVSQQGKDVLVNAYSGKREMKAGEKLNYDFELLITPLKVIDRKIKYEDRYYHGGGVNTSVKVDNAKRVGANIINIHHAEDIYPFINYPYLDANVEELADLVKSAHNENLRMKMYYTTRELTKNLPEFWAFYNLDGEVIFPGPGNESRTEALHPKGPNSWLLENLREKYIPAWYNTINEGKFKGEFDLSVITTPDSRLNNFYVAGLDWMVRNLEIDGVYIDDSALDRVTLRRARKIIDGNRPNGSMDLHSWNHFNNWAGFTNCLNLYMDLLPYFDLVWIGEGRNYNRMPDHWLIEISGIPFGLAGQMLEGGGNPWRGMTYGITNRAGWSGKTPEHLWKFFDEYDFTNMEMIGHWEKDCPVSCNNDSIKVTAYKGRDHVIIAVANWSPEDQATTLKINGSKLGIPKSFKATMPEIPDFQQEQKSVNLEQLTIPGRKGYLIVIKK